MGSLICLEKISCNLSNLNISGNKNRSFKKKLLILSDDEIKYHHILNFKKIINFK